MVFFDLPLANGINTLRLIVKYFFIFFCCISSLLFSKEYKYDLAVCTIFQNDAKYLPEWIEFHQQQGVEHFYLYNNLSQDNWKKMLEKLTMRPKNYIYHTTIKSIVQPEFVIDCVNPHWFIFTPGKFHVSENKEIIATYFTEYPSVENLRINHYWTRDRNFFYGEKLKRYQKWGYSGKDFEDLEKKFNEIHDPIILDNL